MTADQHGSRGLHLAGYYIGNAGTDIQRRSTAEVESARKIRLKQFVQNNSLVELFLDGLVLDELFQANFPQTESSANSKSFLPFLDIAILVIPISRPVRLPRLVETNNLLRSFFPYRVLSRVALGRHYITQAVPVGKRSPLRNGEPDDGILFQPLLPCPATRCTVL